MSREINVTISLEDLRYISNFEFECISLQSLVEEKNRVIEVHEKNVAYLEKQVNEKEKRIHELTERVFELDKVVNELEVKIHENKTEIFNLSSNVTCCKMQYDELEREKYLWQQLLKRRERTIRKLRGK